jgi:tetratricopeptide (TPR) repeat protein
VVVAPKAEPESPETLVKDGFRALEDGHYDEADRILAHASEQVPAASDLWLQALLGRARAKDRLEHHDEARSLYQQIVQSHATGPTVSEAKQALDALVPPPEPREVREVREPPPREAPPREAHLAPKLAPLPPKRRPTNAPAAPVRASAASAPTPELVAPPREDNSPEGRCKQALTKNMDDPEAAVAAFEKLKQEMPDTPCVFKQLGTLYKRLRKDRAALAAYQHYLQLKPDAPDRPAVEIKIQAIAEQLPP